MGGSNATGPGLTPEALSEFSVTLPIAGDGTTSTFQLSYYTRVLESERDEYEARVLGGQSLYQRVYEAEPYSQPPEKWTYLNVTSAFQRAPNNSDYFVPTFIWPIFTGDDLTLDQGSIARFRERFQY